MIPASVMSRFRRSDTRVSRAKYPMRVSTTASAPDAVDAARLVPDQGAAIELDDPAAHHVDDPRVVGRHDDGRAGAVDAVEEAHDPGRGGRVQVSGRLVGQEDQRPVDERAGDGDPLLLATGELVGE